MRVSEYFDLGRSQSELDFVDVDTATDSQVFIDPRAIRIQQSAWAEDCKEMLASFFGELLAAIRSGDDDRIYYLLGQLGEPNETHLGYSKGRSRGRGLGGIGAERVASRIASSKAAESGVLADLEDSALFIPDIGPDIISDISTHVLRGALIRYTDRVCEYYGINLDRQHSGIVWNPNSLQWQEDQVGLPRTDDGPLLLIPKSIVRVRLTLHHERYFNGFLAPHYESKEIDARSNLVKIVGGSPRVDRWRLREKYPVNKLAIVKYTTEFPEALPEYKGSVSHQTSPVLSHTRLSHALGVPEPDYDALLGAVLRTPPGNAAATLYHHAVEALLSALFFPHLDNVRKEREIHEKRKRVDIAYDNLSPLGTFSWLGSRFKVRELPVECKNYSEDPRNPELDQLAGRLSDHRGWVGILTCRNLQDKDLFLKRCKDTASDGRGYLIPLDDDDLKELVRERRVVAEMQPREKAIFNLLRERIDYLIS
ncbi:hypothetical protein [Actinoplanes sp. NPDC026623]|uniref:hypothetical protein n=1 Tax=Actinoplanes sp. NPDC026623 TaxID=3155610 RepID=UPI0033DE12DB